MLELLEKFSRVKILVIGDVMLDRYWFGTSSRLSPEAPVPVVELKKVKNIAGGAANVAANIAGLGSKVFLAGAIGNDDTAKILSETLTENNVSPDLLVKFDNRPTTAKTRVVVHNQHVARIDDETLKPLDENSSDVLLEKIKPAIAEADLIVLSDYAKGTLSGFVIKNVIDSAKKLGKIILVDPKGKDYAKYSGVNLLTPNRLEAQIASGEENVEKAAEKLLSGLEIESLLITLGEEGMKLFRRDRKNFHVPSVARQVFDVTGAGDTVIATLAIALGAGIEIEKAVNLANIAAGISVERVGTSVVTKQDLEKEIIDNHS